MEIRGALPTTIVTAAAVLAGSARIARNHRAGASEERVFRTFNEMPDGLHVPLWTVMQSGSLAAVFVVASELARRGRRRTATTALVAGTGVWAGVKLVKPAVGRGRPAAHLENVSVRGQPQTGLGYPSGHAAVALTLALVASRGAGPGLRAVAIAVAGVTSGARMYVGAHLPLDVAGGLAIGLLCGRGANAVLELGRGSIGQPRTSP